MSDHREDDDVVALRARLAEAQAKAARLALQLDAILGLATSQPGSDPTPSDEAWSPALDAVRAVLRERDEARTYREFARLVLRAWWADGDPGDVDGADLQEMAEKSGLWRQVMEGEHGTDCESCGGDGAPCGELTEAGLRVVGGQP